MTPSAFTTAARSTWSSANTTSRPIRAVFAGPSTMSSTAGDCDAAAKIEFNRAVRPTPRRDSATKRAFMIKHAILAASITLGAAPAFSQAGAAFTFQRTIELPGVTGKFDHFAIDLETNRLFAAATGNHSVEVIDLKTGKVEQSIAGLGKPHGLAWVAGSLFVSDGTLAELRVYKGTPLAMARKIKLSDDADDMVYNSAAHLLYVGHGGSDTANPAKVAVVDTNRFVLVADLDVATHPEALDIDPEGGRVFANIADSNEVAVVATATNSISGSWKLKEAGDNVPMAYDAQH